LGIAARHVFPEACIKSLKHGCEKPDRTLALIRGVICGWRVEDIENPLLQKVRYLDKLIDELAKGRAPEKVFRAA